MVSTTAKVSDTHMLTHRSGLCGVWGSRGWWVRTEGGGMAWHRPHTPPPACPPTPSSAPALHTETQLEGKTENMRHIRHLCLSDIKPYCDFITWLQWHSLLDPQLGDLLLWFYICHLTVGLNVACLCVFVRAATNIYFHLHISFQVRK